jgi:hypothetical protein
MVENSIKKCPINTNDSFAKIPENSDNITYNKASSESSDDVKYSYKKFTRKYLYSIYLIFFIIDAASIMSVSSFPAVVDTVEAELGVEEADMGFLTTMFFIGSLVGKFH